MNRYMHWILLFAIASGEATSLASPAQDLLNSYRKQAQLSANFSNFSSERGHAFFIEKHQSKSGPISCASCHTTDPRQPGRTRANKDIEPMAPSVNAQRFSDPKKVEKWFIRNCNDVLGRECTAREKGDVMTYLLSIR